MFHRIQIDIFIVVNKYLIDSIKNIQCYNLIESIKSYFSVHNLRPIIEALNIRK